MAVRDGALVLGGGSCVWDDVDRLERMIGGAWPGVVVACNDIGSHWPRRLDHWASLHPERFAGWIAARERKGYPGGFQTWGRRNSRVGRDQLTHEIDPWSGGSSGLLAVVVARRVTQRMVLCGIPMDDRVHFWESTVHDSSRRWPAAGSHWRAWERHHDQIAAAVRSMSGRTRRVYGAPSVEWLAGAPRVTTFVGGPAG